MEECRYYKNLLEGLRLKLYNNLDKVFEDARYIVINSELHNTIRVVHDIPNDERPSIFGIELRHNRDLEPTEIKVVWYDDEAKPTYYRIDDKIDYGDDVIAKICAEKKQCKCKTCSCSDKEVETKKDIVVSKNADKKEITLTVNGNVVYNDFI